MWLMHFVLLVLLAGCQTQNYATNMSSTNKKLCEDAALNVNSAECANYVNTVNQRTQQEHLVELQRQGVPVQYEECVQSLPINTVYHQLAIKFDVSEQSIRAFIPESTLNDFAKCTCSDMLYGGSMPDDAIQKCQTKIASRFLSETKDIQLEFCKKNTLNEIRQEFEKQNVPFEEQTFVTKYGNNIIDYCICVSNSKESILQKYKTKQMEEKIHLAEKASIKCAENYLKIQ